MFGQIYKQLHSAPLDRLFVLEAKEQAFMVAFQGEGAVDMGGPYREVFHLMASELMSDALHLFVPTDNNAHNLGDDRDLFMPNPKATSAHALSMFRFLGALFGLCIRTQQLLPLQVREGVHCAKDDVASRKGGARGIRPVPKRGA